MWGLSIASQVSSPDVNPLWNVEEEAVASDASAVEFDFSSQDRIVRGRMPTLELINERFARHMRISLFNMLS